MKRYSSIISVIFIIAIFVSSCSEKAAVPATKPVSAQPSPPVSAPAKSPEVNSSQPDGLVSNDSRFVLSSPEVIEGGMLPREYTCDGGSATLPLQWSGVPAGTQSLAVVMYTIPGPYESHWYWVLYNIPPATQSLGQNVAGVGTLGNNSVNGRTEYAPPCSKGPGLKL